MSELLHSIQQSNQQPNQQPSLVNTHLATAIPILTILVAPLGVAGQNIGLALATVCYLFLSFKDRGQHLKLTLRSDEMKHFIILWSIIIVPIVTATVAKGATREASRFFWGYIFVCFTVVAGASLRSYKFHRKAILNTAVFATTVLGIVAVSQLLFGWKIEGGVFTPQIKRAQGFYSHPLTLAYCALVPMPWFLARWMAQPKKLSSWFLGLSILGVIAASQSVTVMSTTLITSAVFAFRLLPKKQIFSLLMTGALTGVIMWQIPNPLAEKVHAVLSGQRGDRETNYLDDRMAFWHAHWEMFKAAPFSGHGTGLESEDRRPFYDKIGLTQIKRPYEAHNMFLQYAVEGGIIPVLGLLGFLIWWFRKMEANLTSAPWHRLALMATPICFGFAGLTQNAIQDSEVRFLLMITCSFSFWFMKPTQNSHKLN